MKREEFKQIIRESIFNEVKLMKESENNLRSVKVNFENGDSISTSMAAHLTDEQINDYYKIGRPFNLGNGSAGKREDRMTKVKSVEILDTKQPEATEITETMDYGDDGTQEKVDYFLNELDNQGKLEYLDRLKNEWIPDFKHRADTAKSDKSKFLFQQQLTYLTDKLLPIIEELISKEGKTADDQSE